MLVERKKLASVIHKALNEIQDICHERDECSGCPAEEYELKCKGGYILDSLIDNGVTVQEWVPVTERLPEHHNDVLVLDACGCEVAWLMDDGKWSTTLISDYPVTHWMELPEPPKGD